MVPTVRAKARRSFRGNASLAEALAEAFLQFWTDNAEDYKPLSRKRRGSTLDENVRKSLQKHSVGKPASSLHGGFAEGPRNLAGGSYILFQSNLYTYLLKGSDWGYVVDNRVS